jgi:Na+/proline symporter/signal transduction histidine kinase/CheY-like chemotaxis protein
MIQSWSVVGIAFAYLGLLFAIASYGDRQAARRVPGKSRPFIYALSIAVYCTSWTFFGSVGLAAATGYDFLTVYIGAGLMLAVGYPIIQRIVFISKSQNITSIADFIAARYGKSQILAALVTVILVIGVVPYISLQLQAISNSLTTVLAVPNDINTPIFTLVQGGPPIDIALLVALALAAFAILFGTRHTDATEHQDGLMLAIAAESLVKLVAFLVVGFFVTFWMFDGPADLYAIAAARPEIATLFSSGIDIPRWLVITFLSLVCIILLPRQFHVAVVENYNISDVRKAAWLFPLYLVAINVFVIPIAVAGMVLFPEGTVDADMFVIALPMAANSQFVTMVAFVGGLSAATAMVIVASVALAIMVCNNLVVPVMLRRRGLNASNRKDMGPILLNIRRATIFGVLLLAYTYYHMIGGTVALASIGLLSFAAVAQFAPAFFGGMIWRRATEPGAVAGIVTGFGIWTYTLLLPSFASAGWLHKSLIDLGPMGISWLRPQALFNIEGDPLVHGVFWSLFFNIAAYWLVSLVRPPQVIERLQANVFVSRDPGAVGPTPRHWKSSMALGELQETVARYLGEERTRRSFTEYLSTHNIQMDRDTQVNVQMIRFAEHLLASAIGAASSRLVLSLLARRGRMGDPTSLKLLDDASEAIQYNRDLLQTALDHVGQGICVFDRDMRLICWNLQFRQLLQLPAELGRVGIPLTDILVHCIAQRTFPADDPDAAVSERIDKLVVSRTTYHERLGSGTVLEVRTAQMPDGGIVTTFTDITENVEAGEELERSKETLERRVQERTEELTRLNREIVRARADAEQANIGKTRFLAAASHDLLQPLNAARLYTTNLVEKSNGNAAGIVAQNINISLESVEEILGTLLDISRMDTGTQPPEFSVFSLVNLLRQMEIEFSPQAEEKGINLRFMATNARVRSDRQMLTRVVQNLVSNAIKYTNSGRVLVGCRREGERIRIEIHDTGIGISEAEQQMIFKEFHRLNTETQNVRGLGLGLSIVERSCRILDHPVRVRSETGVGSVFSVSVPVSTAPASEDARPARPSVPTLRLEGTKVVIIDNDEKILDGMDVLLSGWGCETLKARNLKDATQAIRTSGMEPNILLVDYHLDEGNGVDVIAGLRWKLHQDIPAILITADRSPELKAEARKSEIPILHKPLKPAALRALMARSRLHKVAAE